MSGKEPLRTLIADTSPVSQAVTILMAGMPWKLTQVNFPGISAERRSGRSGLTGQAIKWKAPLN
jgi:hypothetical protein